MYLNVYSIMNVLLEFGKQLTCVMRVAGLSASCPIETLGVNCFEFLYPISLSIIELVTDALD